MPAFKDSNGKEWLVKLDAPTIKELRSELHVDLADLTGKEIGRLRDDACLLVDVLWVVCRRQAGQMDSRQFGESMLGDPIGSATEALLNAILDFFPPDKRALFRAVLAKEKAIQARTVAMLLEKIGDPTLEETAVAALEEKIEEAMNDLTTQWSGATKSPAHSASVPTDARSANSW